MGCIFLGAGLVAFLISLGLGRLSLSERQIHLLANGVSPRRRFLAKVWAVALGLLAAAGAVGSRIDSVDDERAEVVIENVSCFHPELREYVADHASIAWDQYRWTAGAFVMLKPNELERLYPGGRGFGLLI
jgi:hypothetical protein